MNVLETHVHRGEVGLPSLFRQKVNWRLPSAQTIGGKGNGNKGGEKGGTGGGKDDGKRGGKDDGKGSGGKTGDKGGDKGSGGKTGAKGGDKGSGGKTGAKGGDKGSGGKSSGGYHPPEGWLHTSGRGKVFLTDSDLPKTAKAAVQAAEDIYRKHVPEPPRGTQEHRAWHMERRRVSYIPYTLYLLHLAQHFTHPLFQCAHIAGWDARWKRVLRLWRAPKEHLVERHHQLDQVVVWVRASSFFICLHA